MQMMWFQMYTVCLSTAGHFLLQTSPPFLVIFNLCLQNNIAGCISDINKKIYDIYTLPEKDKTAIDILTLAEKVADNAALWLVESTKAADVDIVIVHAARDSTRLKTCFMHRTVRYVTNERHTVKYIALNDGQWLDSWDKHKTEFNTVNL